MRANLSLKILILLWKKTRCAITQVLLIEKLSSFLLQSKKSKKRPNACQEERGEIEIYISKLPWQVETEKFIILTFEYLLLALSQAYFLLCLLNYLRDWPPSTHKPSQKSWSSESTPLMEVVVPSIR